MTEQNTPPSPSPYGAPNAPYPQPAQAPKSRNVLGIIALAVAIVGFIFGCIPGALIVGWVLLPIAFILGIVAVCLRDKGKASAISAIIISVVGTVVAFVVFFAVVASSFSEAFEETDGTAVSSEESTGAESSSGTEGSQNPTIGDSYEWDDGVAVSISSPSEYVPSETASLMDESLAQNVSYSVTVTNDSEEPVDLNLFTISGLSGGTSMEQIYDSSNGVMGAPSSTLLTGKSATFDVAFGLEDPEDVTLDVSPDFDHKTVTFVQQ